jgi:four helix bundle protein
MSNIEVRSTLDKPINFEIRYSKFLVRYSSKTDINVLKTLLEMKFDLEVRLINFSVSILKIADALPNNRGANHLGGQLVRSGTAPALMYGEAQSAESRKDFIHKMKLSLKELRETFVCLRIIDKNGYLNNSELLEGTLKETNELISIFVKSIATAQQNSKKEAGLNV